MPRAVPRDNVGVLLELLSQQQPSMYSSAASRTVVVRARVELALPAPSEEARLDISTRSVMTARVESSYSNAM